MFFNTIQPVRTDIIKSWSVTCSSILDSLQELAFEVNNDINVKISLCQRNITNLNVGVIVNSVNQVVTVGDGTDGAIHQAVGPVLVDEGQKLNVCETCKCTVILDCKLPPKYVFHYVRPKDKNHYKLYDFYQSCLEKVLAYNAKSMTFCCGRIGIFGFDPRKVAKMALGNFTFLTLKIKIQYSNHVENIPCSGKSYANF